MSYMNSVNIINEKSKNYSLDILQMIKLRTEDYCKSVAIASQNLLYDDVIYKVLIEEAKNKQNGDQLKKYENDEKIQNTLRKIILSQDQISSIGIIPAGKNIYTSYYVDSSNEKRSIKEGFPEVGVLRESARKGRGRIVWYVDSYRNEEGNELKRIYALRTIYNFNNFKEIGLLVILLKNSEFIEIMYKDILTDTMQKYYDNIR